MHIRGNRFNTNTFIVFVVVSRKQNSEKKSSIFVLWQISWLSPCFFINITKYLITDKSFKWLKTFSPTAGCFPQWLSNSLTPTPACLNVALFCLHNLITHAILHTERCIYWKKSCAYSFVILRILSYLILSWWGRLIEFTLFSPGFLNMFYKAREVQWGST